MQNEKIKVYFLGSGHLGVASLDTLTASTEVEIAGIGTRPGRQAGRRGQMIRTAVEEYAVARNLSVDTPASVKDAAYYAYVADISPDIILVSSFGQILNRHLLQLPPHGCLNIHPSILPLYRGPAPISTTILNGDRESGVSFMAMDEGIDTGPVYETHLLQLRGDETAGSLEEKLGAVAAKHIASCIKAICHGERRPTAQTEENATYTEHLTKGQALIDWRKPADRIEREVRAYWPWPRSWFVLSTGKKRIRLQVAKATVFTPGTIVSPGVVLQADRSGLAIACGEKALNLKEVIPEGKSRMTGAAFSRGTRISAGTQLPNG